MSKAYLSMSSLCEYIDCSSSYVKEKIKDGSFKFGVHFVQPDGPKTKLKFIKTEIDKWMQRDIPSHSKKLALEMTKRLLAS